MPVPPVRPRSTAARLLREASAERGRTRTELMMAARHRDPAWPEPERTAVTSATLRLTERGLLRVTVATSGGAGEEVIYRLTPAGAEVRAQLEGGVK